jgi:hypothetical protein
MADREMKNGHWSVVIGHCSMTNATFEIVE